MKFELKRHPHFLGGIQCRINFDNDCGISIITGNGAYCDKDTFEIAPLFDNTLTWIEEWGDQVKGYVTTEEVSKIVEFAAKANSKEEYKDFLSKYEFQTDYQPTVKELVESFVKGVK